MPEAIVQRYATLDLGDVYAVISYYLRHRQEIEAYLAERETLADETRERVEARPSDLADVRKRLLARRCW